MTFGKLAIEGGEPVTETPISFHEPDLGPRELEAVENTFESGWVAGPGPNGEAVEETLENRWSVPRVLTTTSCTHALEMALLRLDLDSSDEVIVPSFTFVSTALAVVRAGGTPVFADVDPETLMLSADTVKPELSESTRAVIHVHYGGFPGALKPLKTLCESHGVDLIEDAAQAFGSYRNDRHAGTLGRFGAFSFHGTKSLTCGEGGLLVINEEKDVTPAEMIRDKGTDRSRYLDGDVDRYTWRSTGSSYVLSDIQAAVLRTQINRWPDIKAKRREVQNHLRSVVQSVDSEKSWKPVRPETEKRVEENGHLTAFRLPDSDSTEFARTALQAEGIEARGHYRPLHNSPYAKTTLGVERTLPVTESVADTVLRLPTHTRLSDRNLDTIERGLRKVYAALKAQ